MRKFITLGALLALALLMFWLLGLGSVEEKTSRMNSAEFTDGPTQIPSKKPESTQDQRTPARTTLDRRTQPSSTTNIADLYFDPLAVYGTVLGHDGKPPKEGIVGLYVPGDQIGKSNWYPAGQSRTNEMGRFHIPIEDAHGEILLRIEGTGHVPLKVTYHRPGREATFNLEKSLGIRGRVLDARTGQPWPHLSVRTPRTGSPEWGFNLSTDEEGRFEFSKIPARKDFTFRLWDTGFFPKKETVNLDPQDDGKEFVFTYGHGPEVQFRVVDAESRSGIPGALVFMEDGQVAESALDGTFALRGLVPQNLSFKVYQQGYLPMKGSHAITPAMVEDYPQFSLETLAGKPLEIPLFPSLSVEGRITDTEGNPIPWAKALAWGAPITPTYYEFLRDNFLLSEYLHIGERKVEGYTDSDGNFVIRGLLANEREFSVHASRPGYASIIFPEPILLRKGSPPPFLRITLKKEGVIQGKVFVDGSPYPGTASISGPKTRTERSNDRGEFRFSGLPPGEYKLSAQPEGMNFGEKQKETIQLGEGETITRDFRFEMMLNTISGRVLSAKGKPIIGILVTAILEDKPHEERTRRSAKTFEGGRYQLEVPGADGLRYTVATHRGPMMARAKNIPPGSQDITLKLEDPGILRWQFLGSGSELLRPPIRLYYRNAGEGEYEEVWDPKVADSQGIYQHELPPGIYDLIFIPLKGNWQPVSLRSQSIRAESGEIRKIDLKTGAQVQFHLEDDGKNLVKKESKKRFQVGRGIFIAHPEEVSAILAAKEESGEFRSTPDRWDQGYLYFFGYGSQSRSGIAPGTYHLITLDKEIEIDPPTFQVPDTSAITVKLRLKPAN